MSNNPKLSVDDIIKYFNQAPTTITAAQILIVAEKYFSRGVIVRKFTKKKMI